MSDTIELTVHPASFCDRPTVHFSHIDFLRSHTKCGVGTLVRGLCEEGGAGVLVTESLDEIRRLCAEEPIPCEEGNDED